MDKDREKRRINRQVRGVQAWASWGLLGIFIPILGVICGLVAVHKSRVIEEDYELNEAQEDKLYDIRNQGYLIIVVSIAAFGFWYYFLYV